MFEPAEHDLVDLCRSILLSAHNSEHLLHTPTVVQTLLWSLQVADMWGLGCTYGVATKRFPIVPLPPHSDATQNSSVMVVSHLLLAASPPLSRDAALLVSPRRRRLGRLKAAAATRRGGHQDQDRGPTASVTRYHWLCTPLVSLL